MVYAAIVAGGTGSRMGADIPKQFLEIAAKPVLIHTVSCFIGKVDRICIACHRDYVGYTKEYVGRFFAGPIDVIEGGADRMESVLKTVEHFVDLGASDDDIILTHDGVRPFVTEVMIDQSIENARSGHFCTVATGATDTVCLSEDGKMITVVPDRKKVFNIQTPQTFTVGKLAGMLKGCGNADIYTDLCGLALAMGENVKIVKGSPENIKITVPADLKTAETIMERNGRL